MDKFTEKDFINFVDRNNWKSAKSYAQSAPHEYVVKGKLSAEEQKIFEKAVMFIRENGYVESFFNKNYTYYNYNGYKFWTMGCALEVTIILNKAKI